MKDLSYHQLQTAALLAVGLDESHSPHPNRLGDGDCCHGCWHYYSEHYYHCHCWNSGC